MSPAPEYPARLSERTYTVYVHRYGDKEKMLVSKRQPKYLTDNEIYALMHMFPYTPASERLSDEEIRMEYLTSERVTDPVLLSQNCESFLRQLFEKGIRHGDLTRPHIFVVRNFPVVIDWAESRHWTDPRPDKRREGDSYWMRVTLDQILQENGFDPSGGLRPPTPPEERRSA